MTNSAKPDRKGRPPGTQLSAAMWRKLIAKAWAGEPRFLIEALLVPQQTDGAGRPLPGAWVALPDDAELRERIVNVLMLGPWSKAASLAELATKTGWGRTKPRVNDLEVSVADMLLRESGEAQSSALADELAADLGFEDWDSLRQRIKALRRKQRGAARKKAP